MYRPTLQMSVLCAALAAASAQAQSVRADAARVQAAHTRAEAHLRQFPGLSLHDNDHSYQVRDVVIDADGASHVRLDRTVGGLRVIGGDEVGS